PAEPAVTPRPRGLRDAPTVVIPPMPRQRVDETSVIKRVSTRVKPSEERVPRHTSRRRRTIALPVLGLAPELLGLSAVGVVLVAIAYVGGRVGVDYAGPLYWTGQVLVYTPIVYRLLSRGLTGATESFLLVMGLALNQYLLKWMY